MNLHIPHFSFSNILWMFYIFLKTAFLKRGHLKTEREIERGKTGNFAT